MADENRELWFTALGPSGAGKTSMLACMQKKFEERMPGRFAPDNPEVFKSLEDVYKKLGAEAEKSEIHFDNKVVAGTQQERSYEFTLKGDKGGMPVRFFDFPGGWTDPASADKEDRERLISILRKSMVIIVAVDTPYIMYDEENEIQRERYLRKAHISDINRLLAEHLGAGADVNEDRLLLFVPIKCEAWTRSAKDCNRLKTRVKELFADTLRLTDEERLKGRLAAAIIPIHTVGSHHFRRFDKDDIPIYAKSSGGFKPKDAEQPFLFAMSFLLNEFIKGAKPHLNRIFNQSEMKKTDELIRKETHFDDENFEIICGAELIRDAHDHKKLPVLHDTVRIVSMSFACVGAALSMYIMFTTHWLWLIPAICWPVLLWPDKNTV